MIVMKLKSVQERKRALNTTTDSTEHASKALLAILILFLVCEIPLSILLLLQIFDKYRYYIVLTNVATFSIMLRLLNASLNLILYCAISSLFRSTFFEIFIDPFRGLKYILENNGSKKTTESMEMT